MCGHRSCGAWAQALGRAGMGAEARGHRLSGVCGHRSCGAWAQVLRRAGTGAVARGHRLLGMRARELWHVGSAALVPGLWSSGSIVAPRHVASSGVRH